jgi:hypothetical protein
MTASARARVGDTTSKWAVVLTLAARLIIIPGVAQADR